MEMSSAYTDTSAYRRRRVSRISFAPWKRRCRVLMRRGAVLLKQKKVVSGQPAHIWWPLSHYQTCCDMFGSYIYVLYICYIYISHLTWSMSLHYLVKSECSNFLPNTGFVIIRLLRFGVKVKRAYYRNYQKLLRQYAVFTLIPHLNNLIVTNPVLGKNLQHSLLTRYSSDMGRVRWEFYT